MHRIGAECKYDDGNGFNCPINGIMYVIRKRKPKAE